MRCRRIGTRGALSVGVAMAILLGGPATIAAGSNPISYHTLFEDPGAGEVADFSLEQRAIGLIDATPPGAQLTFAVRDFNRTEVADALIAAHLRKVNVDGVIDGAQRDEPAVKKLVGAVGAERIVVCGSPTFEFLSCIANAAEYKPSLQHNKFMTFSELADGRRDVVLQTSQNW